MCCTVWPMTVKQKAFLEAIRWADAVYPTDKGILVIDIDFDRFNLGVLGDSDHVTEFSDLVRKLFFSTCLKMENREDEYNA